MDRTGNLAVTLCRRVTGMPETQNFTVAEIAIPVPGPGELLIRNEFLSLDPYMLPAIKGRHMSGGIAEGQVMPGETIGTVLRSNDDMFPAGARVVTRGGWQQFAVTRALPAGVDGQQAMTGNYARLLPSADPAIPDTAYLSVLGMPGLTAYAGTGLLAPPVAGDCFVVSAATGGVGSVAGQLARDLGARVVGIAGGAAKCAHAIEELGFAACVDHHGDDFSERLGAACPTGIDGYFDNVGGRILDVVLQHLALNARIVLCGMIEQYQADQRLPGPSLVPVIGRRAHMMGLVVYDHAARMPEWQARAGAMIRAGQLRWKEDRVDGLAAAPAAFVRLMQGRNFGKTIVAL